MKCHTLIVFLLILFPNIVELIRGHCSVAHFQCASGECIPDKDRCDNFPDCPDESDELNCTDVVCVEGQITCVSGECINPDQWCDGIVHCTDSSDELKCENIGTTDSGKSTTVTTPAESTTVVAQDITANSTEFTSSPTSDIKASSKVDTTATITTTVVTYSTTSKRQDAIDVSVEPEEEHIPTSNVTNPPDSTTDNVPSAEVEPGQEPVPTSDVIVEPEEEHVPTSNVTNPPDSTTDNVPSAEVEPGPEPVPTSEVTHQNTVVVPEITTVLETTIAPRITTDATTFTKQPTHPAHTTLPFHSTTSFVDMSTNAKTTYPSTATKSTTTSGDNFCMAMPDYGKFCRRRYRGYYRHPTNCRNFIMCEWGLLYLCRCPPLTAWDTRIETCVWTFFSVC